MDRILKAYLKRLTNLSTRNKSLLLPGLPSEQFLDLYDTGFLLGKSAFEVIQQLIQRKSRIALCDVQDPRFEKVNHISKKLRKIARTEAFIKEERGSQDLYIGYPFVRGKLSDGTPIHAPFLFFPVTLRIDKEQWCLFEREETGIILNRSFALAYAHFNEAVISDEVLEKSFEDFSKDLLEFRTQLYEWLKETPFKINFNQQLFEEKLDAFDAQKSSDLQLIERNGELKLYPEAVLGIFPQAGSYLVPDYNNLLERYQEEPFQMLLLGNNSVINSNELLGVADKVHKIKEEEILTPFPIDESQENIILEVKSGKSVVVQGPPGSGKSQLICNLMADFAARGKRVLLVCQKRAALDVVYQRLKTIEMESFVALIHDFKNDRAELYRQIASQIEKVEAYKQRNYSLDAIFIERQFTQESRNIDRAVAELDDFRTALFDESESGVSIKELYLTSDQSAVRFDCKELYKFFRIDQWDDYRRRLRIYVQYASKFGADHVWSQRKSFARFGPTDLRKMEKIILEWPEKYTQQAKDFNSLSGQDFRHDFIVNRKEIAERISDIVELIQDDVTFSLFKAYINSGSGSYERLAFIRQVTDSLEGFVQEDGIEYSLPSAELSGFRAQLKKVIDAKKSSLGGIWWDLFGNEKKRVNEIAGNNTLTTQPEDLLILELRVRNRIELENWLQNPNLLFDEKYLDINLETDQRYGQFFQQAEFASDAAGRANLNPWFEVFRSIAKSASGFNGFVHNIRVIQKWLIKWDHFELEMGEYLTDKQINSLLLNPSEFSALLLSSIQQDFDSMVDMDSLLENMSLQEKAMTNLAVESALQFQMSDALEIVSFFENSVRLSWIDHIENKFPQLRAVSSLKMQQWEDQLQSGITTKQKLSIDIAGIKLREATYEDIEKNRLGNRVTYRELNHQVTKKRKIWPIRKLLESYKEEVFSLVPCWMASPEAVSAMFPMEAGLFDLVIFDEASQCYTEYGLPAAFRGKQVVVTGDSKQLSPSDLYKIRFEEKVEEDEYLAPLEIESLLDLAAQSLDQYQLSGHYRSLSLDLIDFSNQHFYKNTLRLLPDFNRINSLQPAIDYLKVDGIWSKNANAIEVETVVSLIKELSGEDQSIGVVTFNFYQQQAIQEAIEKEGVVGKDLFVKNIENVQGDERDIIIFSVGYAPNSDGKISMNFGSLNAQGGENRLNVAVTRARAKIYFVTSLLPSQLETENAANDGPRLLKAYMHYAKNVSDGNYKANPIPTDAFRTDWLLKNRLLKEDLNLMKELPFGDLTIKEEEVYKGLILTDDDLYYRSKSSKEPHGYLPLLLRKKNWPFSRIYSRSYWAKSIKF